MVRVLSRRPAFQRTQKMLSMAVAIRPLYLLIPLLLFVPLVGTFLSNQVNWGIGDFLVMAGLLFVAFTGLDWIWRKVPEQKYRLGFAILVLVLFGLIWAELAVGIFGTPFAGH